MNYKMKLKSYYISNSEYWWQFPVLNPELGTGDSFQYSTQSWVLVEVYSTQPRAGYWWQFSVHPPEPHRTYLVGG